MLPTSTRKGRGQAMSTSMRGGTEVETTFAAQRPVDVQTTHNKPSARYHSDVEAQDVPGLGLVTARCNANLVQISADTNVFQRLYPPGGVEARRHGSTCPLSCDRLGSGHRRRLPDLGSSFRQCSAPPSLFTRTSCLVSAVLPPSACGCIDKTLRWLHFPWMGNMTSQCSREASVSVV